MLGSFEMPTDADSSTGGASCINGADTAWVLLSFVLVASMYPGLALFEAGLLRAKNTVSVLVQVAGPATPSAHPRCRAAAARRDTQWGDGVALSHRGACLQVLVGLTTLSVLWDVIGYTLVYGPTRRGPCCHYTSRRSDFRGESRWTMAENDSTVLVQARPKPA